MANEEMERAIDFQLKSQANLDAQLVQTNQQLRQLTGQVSAIADTQNQFIQAVTRAIETQISESLRAGINELAAKQSRTEEALTLLAEAQAHTDRRLDALIDIVQGRLNGQ